MTNKRKRQEDFQKVKLKAGKKKPRAANATDTVYRVKAIRLSEQLRNCHSLPTTTRKLTITDLLSQMHHYNSGVKHGALVGLQEIMSTHSSVIDNHISNITSEVSALFTDKDPMVRSSAVSVLKCLASMVSQEKIAPFFPLLSAHLSTAMTHIMTGIQEDSLKILDILLEQYPDLLINRSNVLVNNFLELISHQKDSNELKSTGKASAWTLSINPNQKITSQKWRINVLSRLRKFLQALVKRAAERCPNKERITDTTENPLTETQNEDILWTDHVNGHRPIALFVGGETQPSINSTFRLRSLNASGNIDESICSSNGLKVFIQSLIPILVECWIEELPSKTISDSSENHLEPEKHHLLHQVLSIISLLWKLSEHQDETKEMDDWLRKNYLKDFKIHFMSHFPYTLSEPLKQKKKMKKSNKDGLPPLTGLDHLLLNLTLCDVMVSMTNPCTSKEDSSWLTRIRVFVTETLMHGSKLNGKQLKQLLGVTDRLINIQKNRVATEKLIQAVFVMYQHRDLQLPVHSMLLKFFSRLYLKEEDICLTLGRSRSKVLSRWLASLPVQLVHLGPRNSHLSALMIETIYRAATHSNQELLQNLQAVADQIYDSENGVIGFLPEELQLKLVQLLYFLPFLSSDMLISLNEFCIAERFSSYLVSRLIGILHTRSSFGNWTCSTLGPVICNVDYFSFLFSTLIGFTAEKLSWMQSDKLSSRMSRTLVSDVCLYLTDEPFFTHHWIITQAVCSSLSSVMSRYQCFDILQNAITKHLGTLVVIPDSTIVSVFRAVNTLLDQSCIPTERLHVFLASSCYSVFNFLLNGKIEKDYAHVQKRDLLWGECISLLSMMPNVLKLMLQNLQVNKTCQEELPVIAQLLRLLLQNRQLRSYMLTNAFVVEQTLQDIMKPSRIFDAL